jgi:Uncharacterized protein involved in response to NO
MAGKQRGGIPRGLKQTGPVLFSYGFRPFFLGAALWAVATMLIWLGSLFFGLNPGGSYGASAWHSHEVLFGFAPAVLTGFLLTTVPNWSGRLPVAGTPLACLFGLWCAGRLALAFPEATGIAVAVGVDAVFLPILLAICLREIIAGGKWRDLKAVSVLSLLSIANAAFHWQVLTDSDPAIWSRSALAGYLVLITLVGGRMIPSYTRNRLKQQNSDTFPASHGRLDVFAIAIGTLTLVFWGVRPQAGPILLLGPAAATVHFIRLARWRGWKVAGDPLLLALHIAYGFIPLGFIAMTLGVAELLPYRSVFHLLSVGGMAGMMLAVMMRSIRGHTGRQPTGTWTSGAACALLFLAALLRAAADLVPDAMPQLYATAALAWIASFLLFLLEYGPMLVRVRRDPR